jgi:hypothetical protein
MGSFLSATDMKSGAPSFGGPESAFGLYASGQLARRFGLPWRSGGGTLTASQTVDFQAGYEAFNTLSAAFLSGANVCWQSAGWLEGGLVTCFEKFVADVELIELLQQQFAPATIDEASLAYDAHVEVGQGGHFFGTEHTLAHFRDCFWRPTIGSTDNIDRWRKNGSRDYASRSEDRWPALVESYEQPPLDDSVEAELVEFVERRAWPLRTDRGVLDALLASRPASQRHAGQRLADDAVRHQRGDVGPADHRRQHLDHVRADQVEPAGEGPAGPQQVGGRHATRLGRAGAGSEGGVKHVHVNGQQHRAWADDGDGPLDDLLDAAVAHVVGEERCDPALALPGELLLARPVAAQADLHVARRIDVAGVASGWVIEWSPPSSTGITPAEATSATSAVMAACDDSGSAGTQAASP